MLKLSSMYAAVCGAFLIFIFFVSGWVGIDPFTNLIHFILDIFILGLFIFFASKDFKGRTDDGLFHFWQGMTVGFIVYAIASVIFIVFLSIYFAIDEQVLIDYKIAAKDFLINKKELYLEELGEEDYFNQLESIDATTAGQVLLSAFLKKIFSGFLITPLIAVILRKQHK